MEEKFRQILDNYDEDIERYEYELKQLESKITFYNQHKLEEELRISRIKRDSINMIIYRWSNEQKELRELLNKWES